MTDHLTGPELFAKSLAHLDNVAECEDGVLDPEQKMGAALIYALHAQTAMQKVLGNVLATAADVFSADLDGWDDVIPPVPLKECRGKNIRRPACAERHTEDCRYAEPPPEPKHVLLDVGTRVLVSDPHDRNCGCNNAQPYVGKIAGYDMGRTKYQINEECYGRPGEYYNFVRWAFVDNRVQVHPEGPGYVAAPKAESVKQEPTGPRIYVQGGSGVQGYLVGAETHPERGPRIKVHWLAPGGPEKWASPASVGIITADEVNRCPNGQTGDECTEGENQCERCLADEDAEAEAIEESLR